MIQNMRNLSRVYVRLTISGEPLVAVRGIHVPLVSIERLDWWLDVEERFGMIG